MNQPVNPNHRIGSDVYVRWPDDSTVQSKARVFQIHFDRQEAEIGLFPRRWGTPSELHLPEAYRATVPLADLSLQPHDGAEQKGFEDFLIQAGETPPPWTDHAGHVHAPGCEEPSAASSTVIAPDGVPEFAAAETEAAAPAAEKPAEPVKSEAKKSGKKAPQSQPLFSKDEVLKKAVSVRDELTKLIDMLSAT